MDLSYVIGGLFLTAFVYLFFPVVYTIAKGRVKRKKAIILALSNSLVLGALFAMFDRYFGIEPSFGPMTFYFFLAWAVLEKPARRLGRKKSKTENISSGKTPSAANADSLNSGEKKISADADKTENG